MPVIALEWRIKEDVPTNLIAVKASSESMTIARRRDQGYVTAYQPALTATTTTTTGTITSTSTGMSTGSSAGRSVGGGGGGGIVDAAGTRARNSRYLRYLLLLEVFETIS